MGGPRPQQACPGWVRRACSSTPILPPWPSRPGPRMAAFQHPAQVLDVDPRVARRGLQAPVAEQLLDVAHVGAAAQQVRRAGVAQRVRRDATFGSPRPWRATRTSSRSALLSARPQPRSGKAPAGSRAAYAAQDGFPAGKNRGRPRRVPVTGTMRSFLPLPSRIRSVPASRSRSVRSSRAHSPRSNPGAVEHLEDRAVALAQRSWPRQARPSAFAPTLAEHGSAAAC